MPFGRQKPPGHFFVIFLKNTKNYNIVDNFGINNRSESAGDEIKLFNVHGYCIFSLSSIFMASRENNPINMFGINLIGNEMNSYWKILYDSFIKVKGWLISSIGVMISLVTIYFNPQMDISLKIILPLALLFFIIIIILLDASLNCYHNMTNKLPKIILSKPPPNLYEDAKALLLLEKSDLFGHEAIVSVYHKEEGFEEYIGNGFVLTIQENGFIQVLVLKNNDERHSVLWDKIMSGNKQTLENMIVRPTVSKSVLSSGE